MFGVGPMEMMIVGFIALLLFGKRLPEVAGSIGKAVIQFKKGVAGIEEDINETFVVRRRKPQSRPLASDDRSEQPLPSSSLRNSTEHRPTQPPRGTRPRSKRGKKCGGIRPASPTPFRSTNHFSHP